MRSFHSTVIIQSEAFLKDHMHYCYRVILQNYNVVAMHLNSQRVAITVLVCLLFLQNILFPNNIFPITACPFFFPQSRSLFLILLLGKASTRRTPQACTEVLTLLGCLKGCIYFGKLKRVSGKKPLSNRGVCNSEELAAPAAPVSSLPLGWGQDGLVLLLESSSLPLT